MKAKNVERLIKDSAFGMLVNYEGVQCKVISENTVVDLGVGFRELYEFAKLNNINFKELCISLLNDGHLSSEKFEVYLINAN